MKFFGGKEIAYCGKKFRNLFFYFILFILYGILWWKNKREHERAEYFEIFLLYFILFISYKIL